MRYSAMNYFKWPEVKDYRLKMPWPWAATLFIDVDGRGKVAAFCRYKDEWIGSLRFIQRELGIRGRSPQRYTPPGSFITMEAAKSTGQISTALDDIESLAEAVGRLVPDGRLHVLPALQITPI
ncbi:MAG: hypothetical protein ACP5I3_10995 [Thermoproteus sp.]